MLKTIKKTGKILTKYLETTRGVSKYDFKNIVKTNKNIQGKIMVNVNK